MRLLALTTSFPLRERASAGVFVKRLYEHLPSDWRVEVICPADDIEPESSDDSQSRIRVRPVYYAPRPWRVLAQRAGGVASGIRQAPWRIALVPLMLFGLWWRCVVDGRRCDVLHANWAVCGAIASLAAMLCRRPVVTTLRGDDVTRAAGSTLDRWLLNAAVRGSRFVVCVSEAMAEELRARYPEKGGQIRVCLNGVDPALFAVDRSPPDGRRMRVAAAGSLIRRKGYDLLIEAVARMRHRDAIQVAVAGAGPELDRLKRQAALLGIQDRMDFIGELAPNEIPAFLANADVFVLPSRSEGRPNVVVEALAAGLPVISSDLPGTRGLVVNGVNGWSVPVDDADALAAALDTAFADPGERERLGIDARRRTIRLGHTWTAASAQYASLFQSAIEMRAGEA